MKGGWWIGLWWWIVVDWHCSWDIGGGFGLRWWITVVDWIGIGELRLGDWIVVVGISIGFAVGIGIGIAVAVGRLDCGGFGLRWIRYDGLRWWIALG